MEYHVFKVKYKAGEYRDEEDEKIVHHLGISYGELKKICDGEKVEDIAPILKGADLPLVETGSRLRLAGLYNRPPNIFCDGDS